MCFCVFFSSLFLYGIKTTTEQYLLDSHTGATSESGFVVVDFRYMYHCQGLNVVRPVCNNANGQKQYMLFSVSRFFFRKWNSHDEIT